MNKQGLAKELGMSTNTIAAWLRRGCPVTKQGDGSYLFDLSQVQAWREKTRRVTASVDGTLAAAQLRKETALADLREMEVRRKRGELVEKVKVEAEAFRCGRTVRDALMAVPDRLAAVLASETDQKKVHLMLTKEIRQALEALSAEPEGSSDEEIKKKARRKRLCK